MEKRAIVLTLALTLPLALYAIPYAYAAQTTSDYVTGANVVANYAPTFEQVTTDFAYCNPGDYAVGGGYTITDTTLAVTASFPTNSVGFGYPATAWGVTVVNPSLTAQQFFVISVTCQTPVTVAGLGVPQFGSLYVAIALGAVLYFVLARHFARRPMVASAVDA